MQRKAAVFLRLKGLRMHMTKTGAKRGPKPDRGLKTRESILNAAESVFAELGFAATRLEDVALRVGIRRASLVYYFRNKQELYDEVEARIFSALGASVVASLDLLTEPWDRIDALVDCWFEFMLSRPTAARIITRVIADITPRSRNPVEFSETTLVAMEQVIRDGMEKGVFGQVRPVHFANTLGASILYFVCASPLYGDKRAFDPSDLSEIAAFKQTLRVMTRALLAPQPTDPSSSPDWP